MKYDHKQVEKKWQDIWDEKQCFQAENGSDKEKFYALVEFPYPSGQGLHVERLTELTEYFVICSATSTTQVKALADNVEWHLKYDHDEMPHHTEGYESAQWMLLDYGCVVLHVFMPDARKFYNLENLWKDGTPVTLAELGIEDK